MPAIKLTATVVASLPRPPRGKQVLYQDAALPGFGMRVTHGAKAWVIDRCVGGRSMRMTVGPYPAMTLLVARKRAHELLAQVAAGVDPRVERRRHEASSVTLEQAYAACISAKRLRLATLTSYNQLMRGPLGDWQTKPLASITPDMVVTRHRKLTDNSGPAYANLVSRCLGAVFTFAEGKYQDEHGNSLFPRNPTRRLSQLKLWNRIEHRQTVIREADFARWYQGVETLRAGSAFDATVADYLLLVLFTGLRRNEAARLRWSDISFKDATLTIAASQTKNGRTHILPIGPFIVDLLRRRHGAGKGAYVFPGFGGTGPIAEPRYAALRVTEACGVPFTIHDLRRTFGTAGEQLEIPTYTLKKLLTHFNSNYVTGKYLVIDIAKLRKHMERIEGYLLSAMGIATSVVTPITKVL